MTKIETSGTTYWKKGRNFSQPRYSVKLAAGARVGGGERKKGWGGARGLGGGGGVGWRWRGAETPRGPARTATTARRPGTCRIRCSTPSITLTARPVWNRTSPIRMNSGIGVSEKLATEPTLLRASCVSPASPPRNSHAPRRLITRNENATGRPRNNSTLQPPSIRHAAVSHDMALSGRDRVVSRPALGECQAAHAEQHLDGQREESDRQHAEQPPLRRHQRLDAHRAPLEAAQRRPRPDLGAD